MLMYITNFGEINKWRAILNSQFIEVPKNSQKGKCITNKEKQNDKYTLSILIIIFNVTNLNNLKGRGR